MKNILIIDHSSSMHDYNESLYPQFSRFDGIKLYSLTKRKLSNVTLIPLKFSLITLIYYFIKIVTLAKKKQITIVHWQWVQVFFIGILLNKIFKLMGIKIIYTVHNTTPFHSQSSVKIFLQKIGFWYFLRSCDQLIVHNEYSFEVLQGNSIDSNIIPHGLLSFGEIDHTDIITKRDKSNYILFFGKLEEYKGLQRLADVLGTILVKNPDLNFIIAGKPGNISPTLLDFLETCSREFKNFTYIPNFIDKRIAHDLFLNARALILPYKHIDDSGVINVAINYLVPSVISRLDGFMAKGLDESNSFIMTNFEECSWLEVITSISNGEIYSNKLNCLQDLRTMTVGWPEIAVKTYEVYDSP